MSSKAAEKLVAVCGATGKQGGGVVAALQRAGGCRIRALTRNPASPTAAKLAAPNVELVKAEFEDKASLEAAFKGCDAVFAVTDFWVACGCNADKELQQGKNLVDAAKSQGVKHFVFSSLEDTRPVLKGKREPLDSAGRTTPHFDAKAEIEAYARQQLPGICTFVYPGAFYENMLPGGGMDPKKQPDGSYVLLEPTGDAKLAWCSTPDIGKVAAAVIRGGPEEFADKQVGVNGQDASLADVADTVSRVFGKKVAAVTPPPDEWVETVVGYGMPETVAKDLANMFCFYEAMPMQQVRPLEASKKLVPDIQDLESWLEAHKDKFASLFA